MTKRELIEKLSEVDDDAELFFVSSEYDPKDDSTWMAETQTELKEVVIHEEDDCGIVDVFIVLTCGTFE